MGRKPKYPDAVKVGILLQKSIWQDLQDMGVDKSRYINKVLEKHFRDLQLRSPEEIRTKDQEQERKNRAKDIKMAKIRAIRSSRRL